MKCDIARPDPIFTLTGKLAASRVVSQLKKEMMNHGSRTSNS